MNWTTEQVYNKTDSHIYEVSIKPNMIDGKSSSHLETDAVLWILLNG